MEKLAQFLQKIIGLDLVYCKIILTGVTLFVLWVVGNIAMRILLYRTEKLALRYLWRQVCKYLGLVLYVILMWDMWIDDPNDLITFLGLVSAGLAIACKDPLINFVGWLYILAQKLFQIGDRIQIGEHKGDVIGMGTFEFTLMEVGNWVQGEQSTGRLIHIPNGKIFTQALANYSKGFDFIWNEIAVDITLESNLERAKEVLEEIVDRDSLKVSEEARRGLRKVGQRYILTYKNLNPAVFVTRVDHGMRLTLRYLCNPRHRRTTEHEIWIDLFHRLREEPNIELAYPTRRSFSHRLEGKPSLRSQTITPDEAPLQSLMKPPYFVPPQPGKLKRKTPQEGETSVD